MNEHRLGDVCRLTGFSQRRVRHYERMGLLDKVRRTTGNQRRYSDAQVERLKTIRRLRAAHVPLTVIRSLLRLVSSNSLGGDAQALTLVLTICGAMRDELSAIEGLVVVLRERAADSRNVPAEVMALHSRSG